MKFIPSYPKILQLGALRTEKIFEGKVVIQEKIDGSQFRFGINEDGELVLGSRRRKIGDKPDKMFNKGVEYVKSLNLKLQYKNTYFYAEYLNRPKHNTLKYERTPKNNLVLLDVSVQGKWQDISQLGAWAEFLDIELIPILYFGLTKHWHGDKTDIIKKYLEKESFLGGETIEGVVIKNYNETVELGGKVFPLFCKYTSDKFKERNMGSGKVKDRWTIEKYTETFKTDARWIKAIHRLRDEGKLENSPKDIGMLIREIIADIKEEELENIKKELEHKVLGKLIRRIMITATKGFADFYKEYLLKNLTKEK